MDKKNILFSFFIVVFGVLFRLLLNETLAIPNFEAVTALSLVSGSLLGGFFSFLNPLLMMFFSDIQFGNTSIYLFTWPAFILTGLLGTVIKRNCRTNQKGYFLKMTGAGIFSAVVFFIWTNFGWWLTSGMYPMNAQGLAACYAAGLPFLKNQILSALIFVPFFSFVFSAAYDRLKSCSFAQSKAEKIQL